MMRFIHWRLTRKMKFLFVEEQSPTTFNPPLDAYEPAYIGGSVDAFVSRFSEDGSTLLNSTFWFISV